MSYSDHIGPGHTWKRTHLGNGWCECGIRFPSELSFTQSLPRDQTGQRECAEALDRLAAHGMITDIREGPAQATLWDYEKGNYR